MKNEKNQQGSKRRCTILRHLRGVQLSVYEYAARVTAKNPDRELFATNATIAEETGYKSRSIGKAKRVLAEAGWLKALGGNEGSGQDGRFSPNRYRVFTHEEWAFAHSGQCLGQGDRGTSEPQRSAGAVGEERGVTKGTDRRRSDDTDRSGRNVPQSLIELDPILKGKASPSAKTPPERSSSEEEEKRQAKGDPRFEPVLSFFRTEFKRLHKANPSFDVSDATALRKLLRQQPQANAQQIVVWLKNAFESTAEYPLVTGFRLREFVCHFSKYINGPRHRSTAEKETEDHDNYPTLESSRPKIRIRSRPVEVPNIRHPKDPY